MQKVEALIIVLRRKMQASITTHSDIYIKLLQTVTYQWEDEGYIFAVDDEICTWENDAYSIHTFIISNTDE